MQAAPLLTARLPIASSRASPSTLPNERFEIAGEAKRRAVVVSLHRVLGRRVGRRRVGRAMPAAKRLRRAARRAISCGSSARQSCERCGEADDAGHVERAAAAAFLLAAAGDLRFEAHDWIAAAGRRVRRFLSGRKSCER